MIQISNLTKEYISKNNENSIVALNNISFTLPNKGLVFIVGKSGSGKSTLLNLIGGLDVSTSGSINVDGNEITSFDETKLEDYRNSYLGFIFQDYYLLDRFSVFENIKLALTLQDNNDDSLVYEAIEKVGLKGYENKLPKQLSGGERQRVSIARAIVKKPKLLLADELTANLDVETSKMIFELLKELAKDTLVVVVSHNRDDANTYADRKIELFDGKIFSDVSKNIDNELPLIDGNVINMPFNRKLNQNELQEVNKIIKTRSYTIKQQTDSFSKTKEIKETPQENKFKSYKMNKKNLLTHSFKFARGNILNSIGFSFLFSILILIVYICFSFSSLSVYRLADDAQTMFESDYYVLNKGNYPTGSPYYLETGNVVAISEDEIQKFYDDGYQGKIYRAYSDFVTYSPKYNVGGGDSGFRYIYSKPTVFYPSYGSQTVPCDMEFLTRRFGKDGNINVLAGSLDSNFKPYGYIITDYAADAILYNYKDKDLFKGLNKQEAYQKIIEQTSFLNRQSIKAIVETKYMDKYSSIYEQYQEYEKIADANTKSNFLNTMSKQKLFMEFTTELFECYTTAYFLGTNEEFYDNYFDDSRTIELYFSADAKIIKDSNILLSSDISLRNTKEWFKKPLNDGEVLVSNTLYNKLFNTNLSYDNQEGFVPQEIRLSLLKKDYMYNTITVDDVTVKIVGLGYDDVTPHVYFTNNDLKKIARNYVVTSGLYFDNIDSITKVYVPNSLEFKPFFSVNKYYEAAYEINELVDMFKEIFLLILVVLVIICAIIITSFAIRTIKRKTYDVGVYKAIGGKNTEFTIFFTVQLLLILVSIITFSTLLICGLANVLNQVMVNAFTAHIKMEAIKMFSLIKADAWSMLEIYLVVFVILAITSITSLFRFSKIKPINIIRNSK